MPQTPRILYYTAICFALVVLSRTNTSFGQEDEIQTSAPAATVDPGFLFSGEAPTTIEQLKFMEGRFAEISEKVKAATVNIQIEGSQGSGVLVSSDGYILTAAHVIGRPNRPALVNFIDESGKEKQYEAETLGVERGVDSGMLKIKDAEGEEFPYLDIAISDELKEGQWVMAVGHPGGIEPARGMVVRVGRIISLTNRVIRTDCTLVGGDSGGPLIDMNGDMIGIHSRIGSKLVENLHVPADVYSMNWDLLAKGIVIDGRPSLGLSVVDKTNEVEKVSPEGAAKKAGIEKGDVIVKLGSIPIEDSRDIFDAIIDLNLRPYEVTEIVVLREGEEKTIEFEVGDWMPIGKR
jgi:serine protease Do